MAVSESLVYRILADNKQFKKQLGQSQRELKSFHSKSSQIGNQIKSTLAGVFAIGAITSFGRSVIETTANFQKMEAVLTNTLGSGSAAQNAMQMITDFAARTPFQVDGLTGAFVKLANQGFIPTQNEMRKMGDLASSTGKEFDQLAEAIIDGQVGEFERLKEFGIRASKQGDQVKFTFKGVEQQVQFTDQAIRDYILSLGDATGVSGSMAAISETVGGKISNLNDNFTQLKKTLGDQSSGVIASILDFTNQLLQGYTALAAGELTGEEDPFKLGKIIGGNLKIANEDIGREVDKMESKFNEMKDTVIAIERALKDVSFRRKNPFKIKDLEATQSKLNDEMLKYRGIISTLTQKLEDYNTATDKTIQNQKELFNAQKTAPGNTLQSIGSDGPQLAEIGPINLNPAAVKEQMMELREIISGGWVSINEVWINGQKQMDALNVDFRQIFEDTANSMLDTIGEGGKLKDVFSGVLSIIGENMQKLGVQLLAVGIGLTVFKKSLQTLNGPAAIAAGIALAAAGTAFKAGASSFAGSFGGGG